MNAINQSSPLPKKDFVEIFEQLVRAFCQKPDKCSFQHTNGMNVIVTIRPHKIDYGTVLGKKKTDPLPGFKKEMRTLDGLKVIFNRMAQKNGLRGGDVTLAGGREYTGDDFERYKPVPYAKDWDGAMMEQIAHEVLPEVLDGNYQITFESITEIESKMTIIVFGQTEEGLEAAINAVFAACGSNTGKKLRVELMAAEETK